MKLAALEQELSAIFILLTFPPPTPPSHPLFKKITTFSKIFEKAAAVAGAAAAALDGM